MCWNYLRKHRGSFLVVFILFYGGYEVLHQKILEKRDIQKRLDKIKPTVPVEVFNQVESLRWKLVQANFKSILLQRNLLHFHQAIKQKELMPETELKEKRQLSLTSVQLHLPHLSTRGLKPLQVIAHSTDKTVSVCYGIAINDFLKSNALIRLLHSLFQFLTVEDRKDVLFVVYINTYSRKDKLIDLVSKEFSKEIENGLLDIVVPPLNYYPSYGNIGTRFSNTRNETIQNSKENLDIAYLMMYARTKAAFYVQLSTDLLALPQYVSKIKKFAIKKASTNEAWFTLSFTTQGCSGKLYRSEDLDKLILFFLMHHDVKPCDWIVLGLVGTIFCHLEKENCDGAIKRKTKQYRPVLFKKAS